MLFADPLLSLSNLKATAVTAGLGPAGDDGGVALRSVYWRFYLGLLPPPGSLDLFPPALETQRRAYDELRARFLVAPDGRWAADCSGGEGYAASTSTSTGDAWSDPLSLESSSPWKTWFAHLDLRATIRQDVDRTFPDIPYFAAERVRRSLTTMLFLFSVLNPDVGYRQGMHELLAVCMVVADRDSIERAALPEQGGMPDAMYAALGATLDRAYVEHDAFHLFQELMKPAKSFYEWRVEEGPAPIIVRCNRIHSQLVRRIDPQLWERLDTEGIEAQIWLIRWIRLLLTRELPFGQALRLWDGMFADDPGLGILDFVCVAMLLLIRNELMDADYPTILTHLLHYPSPSPTYPFNPSLILSQAKFLSNNISPAGGVEVVLQNQEHLGIKASGHDTRRSLDDDGMADSYRVSGTPPSRPSSSSRAGKPKGLAAGLFERAQKAGLDKAFADLRSSLPDSATAYSFLPSFAPQAPSRESSPISTIPSTTAALPPRPALQPTPSVDSLASTKSLLDAERQMAELRLAMVAMGKAMGEWLEVIREGDSSSAETAEAWRGLDRVRDGLLDAAGNDVEDLVQAWAWNDGLDSSRSRGATPVTPSMAEPPQTPVTPMRSGAASPPRNSVQITPKAPARAPAPAPVSTSGSSSATNPPLASPVPVPTTARPAIFLSHRDDRPSPTLPRMPISRAPVSTPPARATPQSPKSPQSPRSPPAPVVILPKPRVSSIGVVSDASSSSSSPMDPLAGIGVGVIARDERRRSLRPGGASQSPTGTASAPSSGSSGRVSDPLGVGSS
ncbi:hypothetical protein Q8F55_003022 [Vanrija albida]|uniref:Rab-GAP TBC domain-containing protein n=1 Tax=Vanrija albida TaxID=181172 RepID=A0ABR3QBK4_9TREE